MPNRLAIRGNAALRGAAASGALALAHLAASSAKGAVEGMGERMRSAAHRYMRGDVNQPRSADTTMQVAAMRPVGGRMRRQRGPSGISIHERGSLRLADVTTAGTVSLGTCVLSIPLDPDHLGGRLYKLSTLYARWKFTKAVLRYVPSVSSATDGGLIVMYSQDHDETYEVGESVGGGNAVAAIDNMEFSVREKMNMPLHLSKQLLFTTPTHTEPTWHTAGVVNVINNGSLVINKTYGNLYLDFEVTFEQPCAPFDVYAPLQVLGTFIPHGSGASGTINGPVFNWTSDVVALTLSSGPKWIRDPATGSPDANGRIYIPPGTSAEIRVQVFDAGAAAGNLLCSAAGCTIYASATENSTDVTMKSVRAIATNTSTVMAYVTPYVNVAGCNLSKAIVTVTAVPFRTS